MLLSGLVYQYEHSGCNATYHGKTKRHFNIQICKHLGISHLTGKSVKINNNKLTAIQEASYVATALHALKTFPF